jgi:acetyl-CoA carboxylase carboxyltransferase component
VAQRGDRGHGGRWRGEDPLQDARSQPRRTPKKEEARLVAEYREKFCSPYEAAKKAMITDVISPAETRAAVALALRNTLSKRETRPAKKHGTIPM